LVGRWPIQRSAIVSPGSGFKSDESETTGPKRELRICRVASRQKRVLINVSRASMAASGTFAMS